MRVRNKLQKDYRLFTKKIINTDQERLVTVSGLLHCAIFTLWERVKDLFFASTRSNTYVVNGSVTHISSICWRQRHYFLEFENFQWVFKWNFAGLFIVEVYSNMFQHKKKKTKILKYQQRNMYSHNTHPQFVLCACKLPKKNCPIWITRNDQLMFFSLMYQ